MQYVVPTGIAIRPREAVVENGVDDSIGGGAVSPGQLHVHVEWHSAVNSISVLQSNNFKIIRVLEHRKVNELNEYSDRSVSNGKFHWKQCKLAADLNFKRFIKANSYLAGARRPRQRIDYYYGKFQINVILISRANVFPCARTEKKI